jgi:hypothetical protein
MNGVRASSALNAVDLDKLILQRSGNIFEALDSAVRPHTVSSNLMSLPLAKG